ncbi:MAG: cytochrome c [Opitutaceae bacterium]
MSCGWWALGAIALLAGGCRSPESELPSRSFALAEEAQTAPAEASRGHVVGDVPSDAELWRMSRDSEVVKAGQAAFSASSCRTCHGFTLTGGAAPNLIDRRWLHGGTPREVFATIARGVPSKGMPTWGPVLGPKTIATLVAYIFSHHGEGEPIEVQASFTPFTPIYDLP